LTDDSIVVDNWQRNDLEKAIALQSCHIVKL
jgi:hypothetical protein